MEAEEFLMKEYDLKKEGLIIPAKNYFKVDMTLAELENLLIRYAKIKVREISSSAVLTDSSKTDNETEIIDAIMSVIKKYYPKKDAIPF
jgi:hypothetical protein